MIIIGNFICLAVGILIGIRYKDSINDDWEIVWTDYGRWNISSEFGDTGILRNDIYKLPTSLIRTDEVITKEEYPEEVTELFGIKIDITKPDRDAFLAGRKSFGDKEFHLTREELRETISNAFYLGWNSKSDLRNTEEEYFQEVISSFTTPQFPHTITVQKQNDVFLWETIKCEY